MQGLVKISFLFFLFFIFFFIISRKSVLALYGAGPNCRVVNTGTCSNNIWYATCQGCQCDAINTGACQYANKSSCLNCTFSCNLPGSCSNPPALGVCMSCGSLGGGGGGGGGGAPTPTRTPTPTLYPTVVITGILKEYEGALCNNNITTNFLSININPQSPAGVTPICGVTPPSGQTRSSYRCTVVFNNQNARPTPAQNLNLNVSVLNYQSGYWTDANACTSTPNNSIAVNVAARPPINTFNKDIFFQSDSPWIKIKNTSYMSPNNLTNIIPLNISPYDGDDTTERYFIIGEEGLASANNLNLGTANISSKNWSLNGYSKQATLTISGFLEYIRSRKKSQNIENLAQLTEGINLYQGDLTINSANQSNFNNKKVVLIISGTATIDVTNFQPTNASIAILASTINFTSNTKSAAGIFVAENIDTEATTNDGLKIMGNLVAYSSLSNRRKWNDNSKPSLFIVFKPETYLNLLPYLSIAKYDWRQLQ